MEGMSTTDPAGHAPGEPAAPQEPAAQAAPRATDARIYEEAVQVRRSPRFARFMIVGGFVFAIIALILTYSFPQGSGYDRNTVFGFMLVTCVAIGVALGAIVALIADRVARTRTRTVESERVDVQLLEAESKDAE
jgi:hypothetical protein